MLTITSFPRHRVARRAPDPTRTARFARDAVRFTFEDFWLAYPSRSPHSNPKKTARQRFDAALGRGASPADVVRGARNYAAYVAGNVRDPRYVMQAATWLNRDQWVDYGRAPPPAAVPGEVLSSRLNGSRVVLDALESDVLVRVRALDLGGASEAELAQRLADLYGEVRAARVPGPETLGPVDLLRRYAIWLGDRDWPTMTTRVLSLASPAFRQFRRELAAAHPLGADPLTGR